MKRLIVLLLTAAVLFSLAACGGEEPAPAAPVAEETPAPVVQETPAEPEPVEEPEPEPVEETPEPEPEPVYLENPIDPSFFDDAVFLGDSVSGTLQHYANETGELGEALFFAEVSYSIHNAISGAVTLKLRGKSATPAQIVEGTGAEKAFITLGHNDIGIFGIEDTISCWEQVTDEMLEVNPELEIYVQSLTPFYKNSGGKRKNAQTVMDYNEALKAMCEERGFTYIDIFSSLADENGDLLPQYSRDRYVHLTIGAGEVWGAALRDPANWTPRPVAEQ